MKKITLILFAMLMIGGAIAQVPPPGHEGGAPTTGHPGPGNGNSGSGHLYGKLVDSAGHGIGQVSVMILKTSTDGGSGKRKDQLLKGTATKNNGDFSLEDLPLNNVLKVSISAVGYKALTKEVMLTPQSADKDLGNLYLVPNGKEMQQVVVTASRPTIKMDMEKKVFNVSRDIVSAGGTGLDILKNVPSVNVDIDGNISLRGSSPQLLVDGKPTTLTLDEIPSDAIESVEVISNPSAKYDASGGGAGILNIVLKKNKKTGYNGNVRAGVDKRGAVNGGVDFNVRQDKINLSVAVNGNQNKGQTTGTTERISQLTSPQTITNQTNFNKTTGGFLFAKVGLDYFATNKTTFSLSGIKVHGEFNPYETIGISTDSLYNSGTINTLSQRVTTGSRTFNGQGLVFGFKHLFAKKGEELTV